MKTLVIRYVSWASHNFIGKSHRWEASFEGEYGVYDWGSKSEHIKEAVKNGWRYKVLRQHKNGKISIAESNYDTTGTTKID